MKKFEVKGAHLTGQIADFPLHVVQAMIDEQVKQGSPADPSVFAACLWSGFSWVDSKQGHDFWNEVIIKRQFDLIPAPEKTKGHVHAKLMKQYAEDAATHEKPWGKWEFRFVHEDLWYPLGTHPLWGETTRYRRKSDSPADPAKAPPTPNEIIQAMLDKGMVVWAGVSDYSYDTARAQLACCVYCVIGYDTDSNYPIRTHPIHWKYAVPIDTTTMTEITEMPK